MRSNTYLKLREMAVFAMLGTVMFCSKIIMEALPNIHLLGMLTMTYTIAFRKKALIPIYIYIMLNGLYAGFSLWWMPYLYIWTILWAVTMLLPRNMPKKAKCVVYPLVCALHGILFGILYSPAQALMFGLNFEQMVAWIISGLPWDVIHGVGNFFAGLLIFPLSELLKRLMKKST
jgi:energy-coupling factor transport system substrate-specific component